MPEDGQEVRKNKFSVLLALFRAKDNVRLRNVRLIDENDNHGGAVKYGIAENRMVFAAGCSLHHRLYKGLAQSNIYLV